MHVLCVFRIRGQGRLTSSDLGGKVYAAVLCSFKCLFNLIWTMLVSSVSPVPFFFSVPPASKKEWRRSAFQCSPRCLLLVCVATGKGERCTSWGLVKEISYYRLVEIYHLLLGNLL